MSYSLPACRRQERRDQYITSLIYIIVPITASFIYNIELLYNSIFMIQYIYLVVYIINKYLNKLWKKKK